MNIIIAINNSYVEPAMTMIYSLWYNNKNINIDLYLMYSDLDESSISKINIFIKTLDLVKIHLVYVENCIFSDAPISKWWSKEMYYRIIAFDLLPKNVNKALWLDADIIINGNIYDFYNLNIDVYFAAVCKGCNQSGVKRLHLTSKKYFNSGVILFNFNRIRASYKASDFFACILKYNNVLITPDQDVLNIMFDDNVYYVDERKYNNETFGDFVLTKEKMTFLMNDALVIHFNGPTKPWNPKGVNWADKIWWKYELMRGKKKEFIYYRVLNFPAKFRARLKEFQWLILAILKKKG